MLLNKENLKNIKAEGLQLPDEKIFSLPEKVLQFGTGVLLRGLPDYYIDKANRQGIFNGRVVVVKSTGTGGADDFDKQDGLYTLYVKGIEDGREVNWKMICSATSRVVSAAQDWQAILEVARSKDLQVVISNTTEVGIQLTDDNINANPPASFPGKLLAVLYERYKAFKGSMDSGLVIVPTELIVDNGRKLKEIVLQLAKQNNLEQNFTTWLEKANNFCNSLVDRIVPGKPNSGAMQQLTADEGYEDNLRIASEVYGLWAIEGDDKVASVLSFAQVDKGIVITPNIEKFRELKLRLLNATHTLSCAVAILSSLKTVKLAMDDIDFTNFIEKLMKTDIAPAIPYPVTLQETVDFTSKVLDRFRNPNIEHQWLSISAQYSSKMKMRVLPLLLNHYKTSVEVPAYIALGFAAFFRFMKVTKEGDKYIGEIKGERYEVTDTQADYFYKAWTNSGADIVVKMILGDIMLWDTDLTALPGFADEVKRQLENIEKQGVPHILKG